MIRIRGEDLTAEARSLGMEVQHDCGGFRLTVTSGAGWRYVFPDGGICPTATKRECMTFLKGVKYGQGAKAV